jgi:hypothetical protein
MQTKDITADLRGILEQFSKTFKEINQRLEAQAPEIERAIKRLDVDVRRALLENDNKNPMTRLTDYRAILWAQHGWFLSTWHTPLSLLAQTAELLGTDSHDMAEQAIANHFESTIQTTLSDLSNGNPERAHVIRDAFDAHSKQLYNLSIPVFLAQADGIGAAFFGVNSIYTLSDVFEKVRARKMARDEDEMSSHMHFLIASLGPINASRGKRAMYSHALNRHAVLHGESTDYGSKINSLKSISWLKFVSELVRF